MLSLIYNKVTLSLWETNCVEAVLFFQYGFRIESKKMDLG